VVPLERRGAVLNDTPLAHGPGVRGLNLIRGCVHRCAFCSVRGSPHYGGDGEVQLYTNTAGRLAAELDACQRRPHAVHVSPATDPFPPMAAVQEEAARVVEALASSGVEAWLMTRGHIRPAALAVLAAHREKVKVTVPITTCDRALQRALEPLTASPRLRLRQIARLRRLGVRVQVALDPLIPGVTDTRENLAELLAALARAGVRQVTAGYLFLRDGIADNLRAALERHGLAPTALAQFVGGPMLSAPGLAPARYLPRSRRQRGYAALMALAAGHGITVTVSVLTNPDFTPPRPAAAQPRPRLFPLFQQQAVRAVS
jgi:DNA repair photolyase